MNVRKFTILLAVIAVAHSLATSAMAHPIVGRDRIKFSQQPMDQTAIVGQIYWGHDELSTAYAPTGVVPASYRGRFTADDFADTLSTPVVHVKWWGSYLNNSDQQFGKVNKFLIAFEEDVPATNPLGFSYPDPNGPIHHQIVTAGPISPQSGTFTESPYSPGGPPLNEALYEYNAELALPFAQKPDTVYWLKIVALVDHNPTINPLLPNAPVTRWGWHNRDYTQQNLYASPAVSPGENQQGVAASGPIWHFQDDAVTGEVNVNTFIDPNGVQQSQNVVQFLQTFNPEVYIDNIDGPGAMPPFQGISGFSQDQAFELYTIVPEPTTCVLMALGVLGFFGSHRRPRRMRD